MTLLLLLAALLGGCAGLSSNPPAAIPAQLASATFAMNGRISANHQGKRHSAGLRWMHQMSSDEILLLAPLGYTVARVYRDDQQATLEDSDKSYQAEDAETLMEQVLGWHLPLNGLHQWVLGLPDLKAATSVTRVVTVCDREAHIYRVV